MRLVSTKRHVANIHKGASISRLNLVSSRNNTIKMLCGVGTSGMLLPLGNSGAVHKFEGMETCIDGG